MSLGVLLPTRRFQDEARQGEARRYLCAQHMWSGRSGVRQDLDCDSRSRVAVESRGLLDKLEWGQVSRLAMIAVSQLNSGSERRSSDSHILDAAHSSVLWIMYYAVAVAVIRQLLLRLTGWSCRISRFATPDRISQKADVELGHPADVPRYDGFAWGSFRDQGSAARGEPGSAGGAEESSDGLPLSLSQKSAPWTNLSWSAKVCLPVKPSSKYDTSDCATTTPR